jgi:hypothetical protein
MAKSTSLMLTQNANNGNVKLTITDTTVPALVFTAGPNDSLIKSLVAVSDDTAAVNLQVYIVRSAVNYLLGTINIPTLSGTNGTAVAIDLLNASGMAGLPLDPVGKRYIELKTGETLKVGCLATMTTAKTCTVSALGEDF